MRERPRTRVQVDYFCEEGLVADQPSANRVCCSSRFLTSTAWQCLLPLSRVKVGATVRACVKIVKQMDFVV
jgi:hypothetical protein